MVLVGTEGLQSFFRPGDWFRLKVMTPLLGTRNPSAPVGDKSGEDRRAARSLLSCALWRGMGRLWRGMGGIGRPEPLSAHHPHQQQGLSGFHETRDPRQGVSLARRESQREFQGFHETRITRNTAFDGHSVHRGCTRDAQSESAAGTAVHAARSLLSCALWRGMGRLWRGMGGMGDPSRCFPLFTIVHHCSRLLTIVQQKILRLSQYPLSVHTGNAACKVFTNHGTRKTRITAFMLFTRHETRITEFAARSRLPCPTFPTISQYFPAFPGKKIASAKHESRLLCFSRNKRITDCIAA